MTLLDPDGPFARDTGPFRDAAQRWPVQQHSCTNGSERPWRSPAGRLCLAPHQGSLSPRRTTMQQNGLHHVTAIAGSANRNVAFYTGTLGLRLVKKTVNFDDPRHLPS